VDEYKKTHRTGQLIVSTATGRAYGIRVKLFRELMGFDIGSTRANLRKVMNMYAEAEDQFQAGKTDVLIGMAAYYGAIVRGIDLPETVRYAVFTGVPKFKFSLRFEGAPEGRIAYLLDVVADHIDDEKKSSELRRLANRVRRIRRSEEVEKARQILTEYFSDRTFVERIKESEEVAIVEENGEIKILIADAKTYIQASGRASRMFAGGVTEGAAFVLVDDKRVFKQLERYLRYVLDEEFVPMGDVNIDDLKKRIDESRARIGTVKNYDPVKTVLFIVESPNKARTIANFFGKPSVYRIGSIQGYEVTTGKYILNIVATRGHMFDLVTNRGIHGVEQQRIPRRCTVEGKCLTRLRAGKRLRDHWHGS